MAAQFSIATLITALLFVCPVVSRAAVEVYPALPGYPLSSSIKVDVDGKAVPVIVSSFRGPTYQVALFGVSGTAQIVITAPGGIPSYSVHPVSKRIQASVSGNTLSFNVSEPLKLQVKIGSLAPLLLIMSPPCPAPPSGARVFAAGTHDVGVMSPGSGQTIFLAPGARVKGAIKAKGVSGVKILGRGVLDCSKYSRDANGTMGIEFTSCSNIQVEGIGLWCGTKFQSHYVSCKGVTISHFHTLAFVVNNDGIDLDGTEDLVASNCLIGSGDDGFGWHALNNGPATRNCKGLRSVIINKTAGNGIRIGASMEQPLFENVLFQDIDIIEAAGAAIYSDHSDWAVMRNLRFERVNYEESGTFVSMKIGKTQYSCVTEGKSYCKSTFGRFENLQFVNMRAVSGGISLSGYGEGQGFDGVLISGVVVGGKTLRSLSDIRVNSYVKNVSFGLTATAKDKLSSTAGATMPRDRLLPVMSGHASPPVHSAVTSYTILGRLLPQTAEQVTSRARRGDQAEMVRAAGK